MSYDQLKLDNQICFPLYACSHEVTKKYKPLLDELDLTYTQYITMMVMWEHEMMTVKSLGQVLHLDSGTLTPLLKRLEAKGLIKRERSKEDERSVNVTLTDAGRSLEQKAKDVPFKIAQSFDLSDEEAKTLYTLLYKVMNTLTEE
ncbi:MAG: MarR family transcriptional regulator [Erysipelotrichaceae bacterium]|nr:MarR family transcriptional regulator [Erysipelotrichaceae bacterium]